MRRWCLFALLAAGTVAHTLSANTIVDLASFNGTNGANPMDGLILSGSTLYGTTRDGGSLSDGTVYSEPITGGAPNVLATFSGSNGASPETGLILSGNTLYGGTQNSSIFGGQIFSLPVTGGTPTIVPAFTDSFTYTNRLLLNGNTFYGEALGLGTVHWAIFSLPIAGTPTVLASASSGTVSPSGGLVLSGSTLYGTMSPATPTGSASIFSLPVTGGTPTILGTIGPITGRAGFAQLINGVILSGNTLYGTALYGAGPDADGEVFSEPITGGTPTVLGTFNGTNGAFPYGNLVLSGNTLYGTTIGGGASGDGTVFSLPVTGGTPTVVATFNGLNGSNATSNLIVSGNAIYGTTQAGGQFNHGTLFEVVATPQVISFSATPPTAFGANIGTLNPGSTPAVATFSPTFSGYAQVSWSTTYPQQYYGLKISDSVPGNLINDLTLLRNEINDFSYSGFSVTASLTDVTNELGNAPPGGFNFFLDITGSSLPATDYFGFDLSQFIVNSDVLTASGVDVIPEPTSVSCLALAGFCFLSRRLRR